MDWQVLDSVEPYVFFTFFSSILMYLIWSMRQSYLNHQEMRREMHMLMRALKTLEMDLKKETESF